MCNLVERLDTMDCQNIGDWSVNADEEDENKIAVDEAPDVRAEGQSPLQKKLRLLHDTQDDYHRNHNQTGQSDSIYDFDQCVIDEDRQKYCGISELRERVSDRTTSITINTAISSGDHHSYNATDTLEKESSAHFSTGNSVCGVGISSNSTGDNANVSTVSESVYIADHMKTPVETVESLTITATKTESGDSDMPDAANTIEIGDLEDLPSKANVSECVPTSSTCCGNVANVATVVVCVEREKVSSNNLHVSATSSISDCQQNCDIKTASLDMKTIDTNIGNDDVHVLESPVVKSTKSSSNESIPNNSDIYVHGLPGNVTTVNGCDNTLNQNPPNLPNSLDDPNPESANESLNISSLNATLAIETPTDVMLKSEYALESGIDLKECDLSSSLITQEQEKTSMISSTTPVAMVSGVQPISGGNMGSKRTVVYVYSERYREICDTMLRVPQRASMVHMLIESCGLLKYLSVIPPVEAERREIMAFHTAEYVEVLERLNDQEEEEYDEDANAHGIGYDCPAQVGVYDYAVAVSGATITAAQALMDGSCQVAINWFGGWHHAKRDEASGFCYLNDIVLGILRLREKYQRVLYIDLDLHHGDGVEDAFSATSKVFTLSFHKYSTGFFPGTGAVDDIGIGKGKYFSLNVPLLDGIKDEQFFALFSRVAGKVLELYSPDVVVCQCGADGLAGDPMDSFNLTHLGLGRCVYTLLQWKLPLLLLGGGGYNHANTSRCWAFLTSLAVGKKLPADVPDHAFFTEYGPSYELGVTAGNRQNLNTKQYLNDVYREAMGLLCRMSNSLS